MDNYKIVDFRYCNWCKHETVNEKGEPCSECLNEPVNMNSYRPIKFEPNEKFKDLLDSGLLNTGKETK